MTATGHALIGALIAARFADPLIGLPLSFLSHFAGDVLPHWDSGTHEKKKSKKRLLYESALDVIISLIAAYILYTTVLSSNNIIYLYANVLAAQLPDYLYIPYFYWNIKKGVFKWNFQLQLKLHNILDKPWGIITQIGAVVLLYTILFVVF